MRRPFQAGTGKAAHLHLLLMSLFAGGCATNSGWHTETATEGFVEGSHVLGELILSATRDQVLRGEGILDGLTDKLSELGYTDADIVDGSEATVWTYCYGHNSGVPLCAHHGHYVVHVPSEFREGLHFDHDGDPRTPADLIPGDLVEIELVTTPSGKIVGKWVGVYRDSSDWGDCRIESLHRGSTSTALSILAGVGPPRANWIECDGATGDGWIRRPVRGAPPSESFPVSEWIKLPKP